MVNGFIVGEIGGQLGLFVGVSILTVCEVLEIILLACTNNGAPSEDE